MTARTIPRHCSRLQSSSIIGCHDMQVLLLSHGQTVDLCAGIVQPVERSQHPSARDSYLAPPENDDAEHNRPKYRHNVSEIKKLLAFLVARACECPCRFRYGCSTLCGCAAPRPRVRISVPALVFVKPRFSPQLARDKRPQDSSKAAYIVSSHAFSPQRLTATTEAFLVPKNSFRRDFGFPTQGH